MHNKIDSKDNYMDIYRILFIVMSRRAADRFEKLLLTLPSDIVNTISSFLYDDIYRRDILFHPIRPMIYNSEDYYYWNVEYIPNSYEIMVGCTIDIAQGITATLYREPKRIYSKKRYIYYVIITDTVYVCGNCSFEDRYPTASDYFGGAMYCGNTRKRCIGYSSEVVREIKRVFLGYNAETSKLLFNYTVSIFK
jgi:hypothetical protein